MTLLQTCLHSLAVMLEIKLPAEISDSIKLIEEVLSYLSALINFAPKQCVVCVKQMLKFMFRMNYTCRIEQYQQFYDLPNTMTELDIAAVFEMARNFSYESFAMLLPTASTNNIGVHIKVFQPIVLRCLKVSGTYSFFFVFRSFVRNKYILRRVKGTFLEVARFIVLWLCVQHEIGWLFALGWSFQYIIILVFARRLRFTWTVFQKRIYIFQPYYLNMKGWSIHIQFFFCVNHQQRT